MVVVIVVLAGRSKIIFVITIGINISIITIVIVNFKESVIFPAPRKTDTLISKKDDTTCASWALSRTGTWGARDEYSEGINQSTAVSNQKVRLNSSQSISV